MRSLLVLCSYHHHNTARVAEVMAKVLGAEIRGPQEIRSEELLDQEMIGFGSGIYDEKHHRSLLELADRLPQGEGRRAFIFSTNGTPAIAGRSSAGSGASVTALQEYVQRFHAPLREKLLAKGWTVVGEFSCPGLNTNSFLRLFGGINKGRPSVADLELAEGFARSLVPETR